MKKKQSSGSKLNAKLLHTMTASAMPMEQQKPMLHLTGKEAKAMHGRKPGSPVKMMVHGRLMNVGLSQYGPDKGAHEASVEIHRMRVHGKGKKGATEKETPAEDKAEGGVEE